MTRSGRAMAMAGMLLLSALTATAAWSGEPSGIPTIEFGQVVNSRDWVLGGLPWFCRKTDHIYATQAPRLIARRIAYRPAVPVSMVTPVLIITEEEEDRLGFTP